MTDRPASHRSRPAPRAGALDTALDLVLDRSLLLGYTKIGPALRRRWWAADPPPGALEGRHVLVTGATSGIGEAMSASFAGLGATVHTLGRNRDKADKVAAEVGGVAEVCDVGDLDAVRAWSADFAERVPELAGVVHNAGVMTSEREESAQGHELGLAVHVLGPHLMLDRLRPALEAGGGVAVLMSSGGMYSAGLRSTPETIEYRDGHYDGVRAYARTKRMQVVLAAAWAQRLRRGPADVEAMHPGWAATPGVTDALPGFGKVMGPLLRGADGGADTGVWLVATHPDSSGTSHFWHDRAPRPTTYPVQRRTDPAETAAFLDYVTEATGTERFARMP